ncbi:hypothetical protein SNK03_003538 [Fusarium graminearum]|uniref:Uncharacterized protein n=1 Tax=Gibberella zeae TaxID=5518 RepID=A0A2H3FW51_GIBZA
MQYQAQTQNLSSSYQGNNPPSAPRAPGVHRGTQVPNNQFDGPRPPGLMNYPSSMNRQLFRSNSHPPGAFMSGYPAGVAYGSFQQNSSYQTSAPRNVASGNWRGSQPSVDGQVSRLPGANAYPPMGYPSQAPSQFSSVNNNGGPVSISDCLNGFAYCLKRSNGRYTRLIPADMLPALNELPASQISAQGMVLLPDLNMNPPQGIIGMNQPVTFKNKIDHIVAKTSPAQQRPTKIYCDKWIHDGTCAFTQQGCKYKHEMPLDKATQQSLGLFHGFPKWWRDHQEQLQKQHNKNSSTTRSQPVLQIDWRGDSDEDTDNAIAIQAPIGAERLQPPLKGDSLSQTHEGMSTIVEERPRTGSETDCAVSPSTVQGRHGSSSRSSTGSLDHAYNNR